MNKILVYSLLILFTLSACKNKDKKIKEDKSDDYYEVLKKIENEKSDKQEDSKESNDLCDIAFLNEINEDIENVSYSKIESFLLSFNYSCKNNVEYSEYSNEILFNLLSKQTSQVIDVLIKNKNLNKSAILEEISSPISDIIDIDALISKIRKKDTLTKVEKEILEALKSTKN